MKRLTENTAVQSVITEKQSWVEQYARKERARTVKTGNAVMDYVQTKRKLVKEAERTETYNTILHPMTCIEYVRTDTDNLPTTWEHIPYDMDSYYHDYGIVNCMDTDNLPTTWEHTTVYNSNYSNKYLDSYRILDNELSLPVKPYAWAMWEQYYPLHLTYDENQTETIEYNWTHENVKREYPALPDHLPVTDENIMTVAWIACRVAVKRLASKGRNQSFTQLLDMQSANCKRIIDTMARMDGMTGLQEVEKHTKRKRTVKTKDKYTRIVTDENGKEVKEEVTEEKVTTMWYPVDERELADTDTGKKHTESYKAIEDTMPDYMPCYHESVLGIYDGLADTGTDNTWDALPYACRAVNRYIDSMRAYRERTYKRQHADSTERQSEEGGYIVEWSLDMEKSDHGSQIARTDENNAIKQYIDTILYHVSNIERKIMCQDILQMKLDGYKLSEIARIKGCKPSKIQSCMRTMRTICDKYGIIPHGKSFYIMDN